MIAEAKVTQAILTLIGGGFVYHTVDESAKAASNLLGVKVSTKSVKRAINRNRHRITYENNGFAFTVEYESKREP